VVGGGTPAPTISAIRPTSTGAAGGGAIEIEGTALDKSPGVTIGGIPVPVINTFGTSLTVLAPTLLAGSSVPGDIFTLKASGADIWGSSDRGHYISQSMTGDGEIIARVASLQNTDPFAKSGVMFRATSAANSQNVFMSVTVGNGVSFQQRLTAEIKELGAKEGVTVDKVLVADASRRTTTANAYVSGLGPTKRVVFYDTMLDGRFSPPELESVAAHELGHVAKSHIWKGLGWFALIAIPGVFLVWWLTERRGGLPDPRLVPLAIAVALVYSLLVAPFGNLVSRRYEAEADWMALTATNDPESFIDLERKLTVTSLGDPDPPAWSNLFFGTHPTPMKRIGMAVAFRTLARPVPAGS